MLRFIFEKKIFVTNLVLNSESRNHAACLDSNLSVIVLIRNFRLNKFLKKLAKMFFTECLDSRMSRFTFECYQSHNKLAIFRLFPKAY